MNKKKHRFRKLLFRTKRRRKVSTHPKGTVVMMGLTQARFDYLCRIKLIDPQIHYVIVKDGADSFLGY